MPQRLTERAPAKVNLSLHVLGRRQDGYHRLESIVAFAGIGDALTFEPGPALSLSVDGPQAGQAGPLDANLVLKAARLLQSRHQDLVIGRFHLAKRLPVAAGLGGGSADAAAALRLLARANGLPFEVLHEAARQTGADVAVCIEPRARLMRGIGDELSPPLGWPGLFAVLVNPRVACPTNAVFARLGLEPGVAVAAASADISFAAASPKDALDLLMQARNDLQPPAIALVPAIADCLAALRADADCRLARMSGSGATVFGLFDDCRQAARAARVIKARRPDWWVRPTILR